MNVCMYECMYVCVCVWVSKMFEQCNVCVPYPSLCNFTECILIQQRPSERRIVNRKEGEELEARIEKNR